ncbi:MAG TPA: transglycosylase domain-containing protein [Candidatus Woesebacteria bacterium]|nr:transglycosylase domain-containing protein [Candidatus Woesebacteria bacterium]
MAKKKDFNQSKNFLYYLGLPVYKFFLWLILGFSYIAFFFSKIFSRPLPRIPKINLPRIKLPKIRLPQIRIQKSSFHLSHLRRLYPQRQRKDFLSHSYLRQFIFLSLGVIAIVSFLYLEFFYDLPSPKTLHQYPSKLTTQILDRNGKLLYKVYEDENRTLIALDSLPQQVKNAFLAAEDRDFYRHKGFSITGVLRAIYKNIFNDKNEGGSTITQQLVKNTLLTNEKTIIRKIKELILAVEVEFTYTKDQIFEMYLNQVGFGGTAYGIQEASRQYFNIDAKDLDLSQAAFLAGLPQAPSKYSPFGNQPELASSRQKFVLDQMIKARFISEEEYQQAINQKLVFNSAKTEIKAPHFVMYVKNILTKQLGEGVVNHGGLIVTTTLDLDLQEEVQGIVTDEINSLQSYHVTNGAALVTSPQTGEILAMVGSKDYFNLNEGGQVNLTLALRQPGSSIKPVNYSLAFENGYGPGSVVEDKPLSFNLPGQEPWTPKNYDGKFHGFVTLRQALGSSYNIPSVILLSKNGVQNMANLATKMGITTWTDTSRFGLSMALGSLEVRMTDMAAVYSTFANSGTSTPLTAILDVKKSNGKSLYVSGCDQQLDTASVNTPAIAREEDTCSPQQIISPTTAYLITDILSDNTARAPAFGYNSILNIKKAKVAVKTGTSNDLRDNWTFGYTTDFLVATWVGNNDNSPMSHIASGITGASSIWAKIVNTILIENPTSSSSATPQELIKIGICTLTGTLPCEGCPTKYEYFVKGTEPKTHCDPEKIKEILNPTPITVSPTPQVL